MPMKAGVRLRLRLATAALAAAAAAGGSAALAAAGAGDPAVAGLQAALRAQGLYAGDVDGVYGEATRAAERALAGSRTIAPAGALLAPRALGSRLVEPGSAGRDVAAAQFLLAWHGFPSGALDGVADGPTVAATRRFQRFAGLPVTGVVGPLTVAALRGPPPVAPRRLDPPVALAPSGGFGPRGARFHAGIDFAAPAGTPVRAAAAGRVVYAGWRDGGFGYHVAIAHGGGVRTTYSHLESVSVAVGQSVGAGAVVGAAGTTGESTGPHLHFEVRVRGAAVDPAGALPPAPYW